MARDAFPLFLDKLSPLAGPYPAIVMCRVIAAEFTQQWPAVAQHKRDHVDAARAVVMPGFAAFHRSGGLNLRMVLGPSFPLFVPLIVHVI